ncbi:SNPH protein, partial [Polypterus senegalus]|nr:SNPH protein [Polypterus senegalus]
MRLFHPVCMLWQRCIVRFKGWHVAVVLRPYDRRPSPPVSAGTSLREPFCTSSLSSSSNSGSCKGSDGSPTPRRHMKYSSCSDNHGIKPPNPEQYLTPLQQKEVCIRHLRARLKETIDRLQERDTEVDELKAQLSRMQEDWIEEECHRVEAQLALKEAKKEIKQLKEVIDTVKDNISDKDMGIQKYFVDINIQNKKLETLLYSMEMAQNGSAREEGSALNLESAGGSPAKSLTRSSTYTKLSDHAVPEKNITDFNSFSAEETVDSGFVLGDNGTSRTELQEPGFLSEDASLITSYTAASRLPQSSTFEKLISSQSSMEIGINNHSFHQVQEQAIQTDFIHYNPDLDTIMEKVMKSQACSPTSTWISEEGEDMEMVPLDHQNQILSECVCAMDLASTDPSTMIMVTSTDWPSAVSSPDNCQPTLKQPISALGQIDSPDKMEVVKVEDDDDDDELDEEQNPKEAPTAKSPEKSYWSRHFLVDLLAVAVPIVPTVAWLCRGQRRNGQPVYNISSLLRGCCAVALQSIRKISGGCQMNGGTQI